MEVDDIDAHFAAIEAAEWKGSVFEEEIVNIYVMQSRDRFGCTILHKAARSPFCSNLAFQRIFDCLPSPAPQLEFLSNDGCTALHYAAGQGNTFITQLLLAAYPLAARQTDSKGYTPLHRALSNRQVGTFEVVRMLLKAYPEAVTMREIQGNLLPLHIAVTAGQSTETIGILVKVCSSAVACSDRGKSKKNAQKDIYAKPSPKLVTSPMPSVVQMEKVSPPPPQNLVLGNNKNNYVVELDDDMFLSYDSLHFRRRAAQARENNAEQRLEQDKKPSSTTIANRHADDFRQSLSHKVKECGPDYDGNAEIDREVASIQPHSALPSEDWNVVEQVVEEEDPPVHTRALGSSPLDVLTRFLSNSTLRPDVPLHLALQSKIVNWTTVLALLEVLPSAAGVPDSNNEWPLFAALRKRAPARVISALVQAHSAALFVRERRARVLDSASTSDRDADPTGRAEGLSALQLALDSYCQPAASDIPSNDAEDESWIRDPRWGSFEVEQEDEDTVPTADQQIEDSRAIIALMRAFPLGAFDRQAVNHKMPFDVALRSRKWKVCEYLLKFCLKKTKDGDESLCASLSDSDPLVDALQLNAPLYVLQLILSVFPEACQYERQNLQWPLHIACTHCSNGEAILLILRKFPVAAACVDYFQKYPLHYACEGRAEPEQLLAVASDERRVNRQNSALRAVQELARACPSALEAQDANGNVPFDIARKFQCSASLLHVLLSINPSPAAVPDTSGKIPFWQVVHSHDTVGIDFSRAEVFLAHSLPVLRGDGMGQPNPRYGGTWHEVLAEPSDKFHTLVERILDDVGLVHLLAMAKWPTETARMSKTGGKGAYAGCRSALEWATPDARSLLLKRMFLFGRFQLPPARDPAEVAPMPAHITTGGTYYQAQRPEAAAPASPVRLRHRRDLSTVATTAELDVVDTAGLQIRLNDPSSPSQTRELKCNAAPERFMCGILAKDQLHAQRTVGIIFCQDLKYKEVIHRAELIRASECRKMVLSEAQLQTLHHDAGYAAFLQAEAEKVAAASIYAPTATNETLAQWEDNAEAVSTTATTWWTAYLKAPERLDWLDCEAENVLHMTLEEPVPGHRQSSNDQQPGTLILHRSPSALAALEWGKSLTPAAAAQPRVDSTLRASHDIRSTLHSLTKTHRFVQGTFQPLLPAFHDFPLICTKPLDLQQNYIYQQLERALGQQYATRPTFCAIFSDVTSAKDLQALMRYIDDALSLDVPLRFDSSPTLEPTPEVVPPIAPIPTVLVPDQKETAVDVEVAVQRIIDRVTEITIGKLMIEATSSHWELLWEAQPESTTPLPVLEPVFPPLAATAPSDLLSIAPPTLSKTTNVVSPRERVSRSKREAVKPSIKVTHRNNGGNGGNLDGNQNRDNEVSSNSSNSYSVAHSGASHKKIAS